MQFIYAFYHLLAATIQSFRTLMWKVALFIGIKKVRIKPFPGFSFTALNKGFVTQLVYEQQPLGRFRRSFEYKVFNFISNTLKPGDIAVDIGGNVGVLTLFMSRLVGSQGHVFTVEASPRNAAILKENIRLNNIENVTLINHAVSEVPQQVFMKSPTAVHNDALLIMSEEYSADAEVVDALPFDQIAKQWGIDKVKMVKIDIEGAEIFFFKGAKAFLQTNKPIIIFESLQVYTKRFNYSVTDVLFLLEEMGYHLEQIDIETWYAIPSID